MANVTIKSGGAATLEDARKKKSPQGSPAAQVIPNIHTVLMPQKTSAKGTESACSAGNM